jgi:phenylacetate-CoA ligase
VPCTYASKVRKNRHFAINLSNTLCALLNLDDHLQFQTPDIIKEAQEVLFDRHLKYTANRSPFYRDLFDRMDLNVENFTLADLHRLPCTTKEDIQHQEDSFLCIDKSEIIEYVTTSGTLGTPVTFMLSERDMNRLAYNEFRSLSCAGGTSTDVYQIMVTLDKRFMAGIAYYLGARQLGAGIVRTGVESLAFQLDTIKRIKPTILIAVPSFLLKLVHHTLAVGYDLNQSSIEQIICIGEPIRRIDFSLNTLGQRIKDLWSVQLISTYASTEMATAFTECKSGQGGHHQPDLILVEILDPQGNPVVEGEAGELVVTPLGVEAMPLLRFRTGDICRAYYDPCSCGRTTMRLGPVEGRQQQMIKLKGTSLYPPSIFDVLNGIPEISQFLVTLHSDEWGSDRVLVEYCLSQTHCGVEERLKDKFRSYIRVVPDLHLISKAEMKAKTTNPMSRKAITLIDTRAKSIES